MSARSGRVDTRSGRKRPCMPSRRTAAAAYTTAGAANSTAALTPTSNPAAGPPRKSFPTVCAPTILPLAAATRSGGTVIGRTDCAEVSANTSPTPATSSATSSTGNVS
ncbi:hypothetical protein GCM10009677_56860 [Sphaerisporangium rubeum]